MNRERILAGILTVSVIGVTIGFLLSSEPEETAVGSEDGVVRVLGVTRETQPFTALKLHGELGSPMVSARYNVEPSGIALDVPVEVAFAFSEPNEHAIYRYNGTYGMWEEMTAVTSQTDALISVETDELGIFALGEREVIAAPEFLNVYNELMRLAPKGAVQYETVVGYRRDGGELIRIAGAGDRGSCSESGETGDGEELSQKERKATVLINDVQTPVTFVFLTRWLTSSTDEGCFYGILTQ